MYKMEVYGAEKKHFSKLKNQTIWNTLTDTKTELIIK